VQKFRIACVCGHRARIPAPVPDHARVRCKACGVVTDIKTDRTTAFKARQVERAARLAAQQQPQPKKRAQRQAERAADQEAAQRRSEAYVAAARNGGVEPTWAPWFNSAEEEVADQVEPAEEPADDIALTVLAEMANADLIPPDRVIPEKFRTMRWQPPW
jgi:hypothetical protein